jgi:hypothetical protein
MPRRLLNVASVVCLVLCVALMGMWVRSEQYLDGLTGPIWSKQAELVSVPGRLEMTQRPRDAPPNIWHWFERALPPNELLSEIEDAKKFSTFGFQTHALWMGSAMQVPYWFLVLTSGSLAMVLRLRWPWRFTLRSLFIATTVLAVVLGMIAWLDRAWIGQ